MVEHASVPASQESEASVRPNDTVTLHPRQQIRDPVSKQPTRNIT